MLIIYKITVRMRVLRSLFKRETAQIIS